MPITGEVRASYGHTDGRQVSGGGFCVHYRWPYSNTTTTCSMAIKRRESSMDFTIKLPRFARRRVPRFARLGLASLAWGSLRSPGVLGCGASYVLEYGLYR